MDDLPIAQRAAFIECEALLADLAMIFGLTGWTASAFRPAWAPLAFVAGVGAARALWIGATRLAGRGWSWVAARVAVRASRGAAATGAGVVSADDGGYHIHAVRGARRRVTEARGAWSDVRAVLAYKRDLYASDLVCLALVTATGVVETDERMAGWSAFAEALPRHLPGCVAFESWYLDVMLVPFEPRARTIFPAGASDDVARIDDDGANDGGATRAPWRAYLENGTTPMLAAIIVLIAAWGSFLSGGRYARVTCNVALVAAAYLALSRGALFGVLALRKRFLSGASG